MAPRRRPTAPRARLRTPCWPTAGALVEELGDGVVAVGLAICELVDPCGRVRSAETVDWRDADLFATFDWVESDVRAAALAEARFGAGRDEPDFLYVSVGSGISHCLMIDGRPRLGVRGSAIGTGAPLVEQWSGGLALARRTGHATRGGRARRPRGARTSSRTPRAGSGVALAALVNALDPGAVIVGGGPRAPRRLPRARRSSRCAPRSTTRTPRDLPVLPAGLRADAPVIGAALAAAARARV